MLTNAATKPGSICFQSSRWQIFIDNFNSIGSKIFSGCLSNNSRRTSKCECVKNHLFLDEWVNYLEIYEGMGLHSLLLCQKLENGKFIFTIQNSSFNGIQIWYNFQSSEISRNFFCNEQRTKNVTILNFFLPIYTLINHT